MLRAASSSSEAARVLAAPASAVRHTIARVEFSPLGASVLLTASATAVRDAVGCPA
jgi:hypothetical protein